MDTSTLPEILLTTAANVGGYALAFMVIVHGARKAREAGALSEWHLGDAALALFSLWVMAMFWYVVTVYWLDSYPVHSQPPWLEATSGAAENIQSEIIQVWLAALVFKWTRWPGSPESK